MKAVVICICLALLVSAGMSCSDKIQEEVRKNTSTVLAGLLDSRGNPAQNLINGGTVTYEVCRLVCGDGPDPFRWKDFAPHFTAWLLPWIALATFIPANLAGIGDKLLALALTLGSPVLAGYTLHLTVLNNRWLDKQFRTIHHPQIGEIIDMMKTSPLFPLQIVAENIAVPQRTILKHNSFHLSAFLWTIIAFFVTTSLYFTNGEGDRELIGQGIGVLWLWLPPIVFGWSFQAISEVNHAQAPPNGLPPPIILQQRLEPSGNFLYDCKQPACNFARARDCDQANIHLLTILRGEVDPGAGNDGANQGAAGNPGIFEMHPLNPLPLPVPVPHALRSPSELPSRIAKAACLGLLLQWGSTMGAIIVAYFTPTVGLGCRSFSFIAYASASTAVWFILLIATIIRSSVDQMGYYCCKFVTFLEIVGTFLAACNAVWLVLLCILQFAGVWSRCWCNSCVLGRGVSAAYDVFLPTAQDIQDAKAKWSVGVVLAICSSVAYILFSFIRRG